MSLIHTCAACDAIIDPCIPHNCRSQQTGDILTASSFYSVKETTMDDWKADERTVIMCIEKLMLKGVGDLDGFTLGWARKVLESTIPKPDPAKALVEETAEKPICGNCRWYDNAGTQGPCRRYAPSRSRAEHPEYAIWPWVDYHHLCGEHEFSVLDNDRIK
jgi:hypothetical protein